MLDIENVGLRYLVITFHNVTDADSPIQMVKEEIAKALSIDPKTVTATLKDQILKVQFFWDKSYEQHKPIRKVIEGERYASFRITYRYQDESISSSF